MSQQDNAGAGPSDEAFIPFAFTIVSVVGIALFTPAAFRFVRDIYFYFTAAGKRRRQATSSDEDGISPQNPLRAAMDYFLFLPQTTFYLVTHLSEVAAAAGLLAANKRVALRVCLPRLLRFSFRIRPLIALLWVFLLSATMYSSMTFDAYSVLELPADASVADVKKAYRKLSKQLHPDQNPSPGARRKYQQVRKAYRALVDRDSFEQEAMEELSAGVALPRFLAARENETWVFFGLLTLLIGTPILLWYKFGRGNDEKIERLNNAVQRLVDLMEPLYESLGVPAEKSYLKTKHQKAKLEEILRSKRLFPAVARGFEYYPALPEFARRCLDPEKFAPFFAQLRYTPENIAALQDYFKNDPSWSVDPVQDYTQPPVRAREISDSSFYATLFVMQQLISECNATLKEFDELVHGRLKCLQKLKQHFDETVEKLLQVHYDKAAARDVQFVLDAPRISYELSREILVALDALVQKMQKDYMKEHSVGRGHKQRYQG